MSIVMFNDNDVRLDYDYCEEDLADEVVGMWVCTYVPWMDADMAVNVYQADGKALFTGFVGNADFDYAVSNIELPKAYSVLIWISQVEGVWKNHLEEEIK